jgi:hypothetical protein
VETTAATLSCRFDISRHFAVSASVSTSVASLFAVGIWDGECAAVRRDLAHVGRIMRASAMPRAVGAGRGAFSMMISSHVDDLFVVANFGSVELVNQKARSRPVQMPKLHLCLSLCCCGQGSKREDRARRQPRGRILDGLIYEREGTSQLVALAMPAQDDASRLYSVSVSMFHPPENQANRVSSVSVLPVNKKTPCKSISQ